MEIDAKSVVGLLNFVNTHNNETHPYHALISDCRYLILSFELTILQHIYHESNICVDL